MLLSRLCIFTSIFALAGMAAIGQDQPAAAADRIQLKLDPGEAEAVLAILDKRAAGTAVTDSDWQRLFATEPYVRLKHESSMHQNFTDDGFKTFVLSADLIEKTSGLRHTLEAWRHADLSASARRALAYLPDEATIKAKVFPGIKPKTNSFVFDTAGDPAIFLYLDPQESAAKFENTVAHELHHIGFSRISSLSEVKQKDLPSNVRPAVERMGAFGEGFAMLAAAGGADVDPHASSSPAEHARWDHDLANFNQHLGALQQFFLEVVNGTLSTQDAINAKAYTFFGDAQGPWYTVGYKMAIIVEKRFGRKVLIECMLAPRELLAHYNQAAREANQRRESTLALGSSELMQKIGLRLAESKPS